MERTPSWLRPEGLEPLWCLNEQALELFVDVARLADGAPTPIALPLGLREAFRHVDGDLRRQLARRPRLLVDLAFDDPAAWQRSSGSRRARAARPTSLEERVQRVAHATTTFAWHVTRVNRDAAIVLLDVSRPLADLLLEMPLTELRDTADRLANRLAPRWIDRPHLWQQWLAVSGTRADPSRDQAIHTLQLSRAGPA